MKLDITVWSPNPKVSNEIGKEKIADGITIRRKLIFKETINPPIDYVLFIVESILISTAAHLIAEFLWNKLKGDKNNKLTINNKQVEIETEKIEKLIINFLKEEKE